MAKLSTKAKSAIARKIREVRKKGVRGRKVSLKQAVAIGLSEARRRGLRNPFKRSATRKKK